MMSKFSKILVYLLFTCVVQVFAQDIAIGQWRDHLAYNRGVSIEKAGNLIYCIANGNVFTYNVNDNSLERLSKVNGLSDVSAIKLAYNESQKAMVIVYANTNIDIIKDGKIINVSDIKNKQILGNKTINNIFVYEQYAYLACGFGIVVLDLQRYEIKDTYYIGLNGIALDVKSVTTDGTYFYASTSNGVFKALRSNPFLSDMAAWNIESDLPNANFNAIIFYNNKIITNQDIPPYSGRIWEKNINGNTWTWADSSINYKCYGFKTSDDKLLVLYAGGTVLTQGNWQYLDAKNFYPQADPRDALFFDNYFYLADFNSGMVKSKFQGGDYEIIRPDGPASNKAIDLAIVDGHLWVAPGDLDGWSNLYNTDGISHFYNNQWQIVSGDTLYNQYGVFDLINVCPDPKDAERVFCSSWSRGLVQINGNKVTNYFDNHNSSLDTMPTTPYVYVGGTAFDADGNIWVTNAYSNNSICVFNNKQKVWDSFVTQNVIGLTRISKILINSLGQKWCILPEGGGILVFDDNGTISNKNDDKVKRLGFSPGSGAITGADALAIAEDLNGSMWIGTDKGICVFYTPSTIFDDKDFDAQQIKIELGGYVEYLLESEIIKCIAVDGANRKWIGTANNGVYLVNADGTKELEHFTKDNSPLLSNTINDLEIDGASGEIYMATANGIISYKYTATQADEDFDDVYAYPNPVKPGYEGLIAIKGLARDCDVKITDISGRLIYATKALGGQAIWDGKNFDGRKAQTGVYIVFCTNSDGSKTKTTKIFLAN
ncbi:MAG: T9SS type A sorting domain-containing protein [Bacteroidia bacterium]|nr:T9SS type A sorting domain-containing protein [Bacteroidia bacterium]